MQKCSENRSSHAIFANCARSTKTHEWRISSLLTVEEGDFGSLEKKNDSRFLRKATEISSDEDIYAFDEGSLDLIRYKINRSAE